MKLYNVELSGNCYKIRLFAALAGIPLEQVTVSLRDGEHKRPPLIDMNPLGQVPVLEDQGLALRDSQAILVYLAASLPDRRWWPADAAGQGEVMQWLSLAAREVAAGPATARLARKFGAAVDGDAALRECARLMPVLEAHFAAHDWAALGRPTIADCALFPYLALAYEGGVDMAPFPALGAWLDRVRALPGFIPMPGV